MSEPPIVQVLIFAPTPPTGENAADRQRRINLALEAEQTDNDGTVRDIVLGTNNFVYAVMEYPRDPGMSESSLQRLDRRLQAEQAEQAEKLALYLTPEALRQAFDGWDDANQEWVTNASDQMLSEIGQAILDRIYDEYRRILEELVHEEISG